MTTLTFHVSRSIGAALQPGDEVIVTGLDHQANVDPWLAMAADRGLVVRTWEPRLEDCTLRLSDLVELVSPRTRLVAVGWASNAVGTINPIAEIADIARRAGAWTFVDAVHAAPHLPLDARAVGVDFLACSTYKFFGPHVGALYIRGELMDALPAYKVKPASHRFETGTGNFEGYAGARAAVEYLADVGTRFGDVAASASRRARVIAGMRAIRAYEVDLYRRLAGGLRRIPGVEIIGLGVDEVERRTPTAAIIVPGVSPRDATGLIERLGLAPDGVVRIGLTHYNTEAEVDRLVASLGAIAGSASPVGSGAIAAAMATGAI